MFINKTYLQMSTEAIALLNDVQSTSSVYFALKAAYVYEIEVRKSYSAEWKTATENLLKELEAQLKADHLNTDIITVKKSLQFTAY